MNYVFEAFASGNQVDVIYTDFRKDFDRVGHKTLLNILMDVVMENLYCHGLDYI
jgi:hypothetical protein